MTPDLFANNELPPRQATTLALGALLLPGFALSQEDVLLSALAEVIAAAPLRHMVTPGGFRMSVAMTNCGELGWLSDRRGYRYSGMDPLQDSLKEQPWPAMPFVFQTLAEAAARPQRGRLQSAHRVRVTGPASSVPVWRRPAQRQAAASVIAAW